MEFRAYFKHMESSLPLFAYAEKKISEKVERFVRNAVEGHITFCAENGTNKVQFHLVAGGGFKVDLNSEQEASMYSAVDLLADKLERKLKRHKERVRKHKFKDVELDLNRLDVAGLGAEKKTEDDLNTVDASYIIKFEKARRERTSERQSLRA